MTAARAFPRCAVAREVLGDSCLFAASIYRSRSRLPEPLPVAIAAVEPLGAPLGVSGRAQALHIHVHHALGDVLDHLPQQIGVRAFSTTSASAISGLVVIVVLQV
jgi:hypothetical protein